MANNSKLSFASWNIRWQSDEDIKNGDAWSKRFEPIADVIRFHDFDIVAIQEGSVSKQADLAPLLKDYTFIQTDSVEHNPILIKTDMFEILDKGRFYLSETPDKKSKGWDAMHKRYCVWAKLKRDNIVFFVFNTHFDHRGKVAKQESAKLIYQALPSIAEGNRFLLAGDFNSTEGSIPYEIITSNPQIKDAKDLAEFSYIPKKSFNFFKPMSYSKWDLDHIFVSPSIHVFRYGVLNETYYDGESYRYPSDHSPIMAVFEFSATN